jgi:hypothetical protein
MIINDFKIISILHGEVKIFINKDRIKFMPTTYTKNYP